MLTADQLLGEIREKLHHPATLGEVLKRLQLPREYRATLRRRLAVLVERGDLIRIRGNRYGLPDRMHLITGRVHVHPRGFGFVASDHAVDGLTTDLYIAGSNLNQAMHGDRVVARVEHRREPTRAEGRIVRILERASARLVGRYETDDAGFGYVVPFDRRLVMDLQIASPDRANAVPGDMVDVEITRFPTSTRHPAGRVTEVLGQLDDPGVDVRLILRKYSIPDAHEPEAIKEARRLGSEVRQRDRRGRTDFRRQTTVTIDGETARDFDDAITLERLTNGHFWLGVHIADVSHYVAEGSALDRAAYDRATSVYFPDRAVHMFPAELSTGLCSLNPQVDRLVQSCLMEIDEQGAVVRYEIHDGVVHSDARMTYTEVDSILSQDGAVARVTYGAFVPLFELMAELFLVLQGRRQRRGSIDFDLPAARFQLDDKGKVEAILPGARTTAHRLIEEFMLVANETVAVELGRCDVPSLYRVHEPPDPLKVEEFEAFASSLGYNLSAPVNALTPGCFQRLLERVRGEPEERPVAALMLRTMQQARYDPANQGHFGLAASAYTHFTSPIRRYPDLVVHRSLRAAQQGTVSPARRRDWLEELPETARHTSDRERRAEEAERELVQWKKVRFMADKVGDEFSGYVTGVTAFGLFVELVEQFVEGLVHISSMADDYYRFDESQHLLQGENSGKIYRLGDLVCVQLVRVDRDHRQLELGLTEVLESVRLGEGGRVAHSRRRTKNVARKTRLSGRGRLRRR